MIWQPFREISCGFTSIFSRKTMNAKNKNKRNRRGERKKRCVADDPTVHCFSSGRAKGRKTKLVSFIRLFYVFHARSGIRDTFKRGIIAFLSFVWEVNNSSVKQKKLWHTDRKRKAIKQRVAFPVLIILEATSLTVDSCSRRPASTFPILSSMWSRAVLFDSLQKVLALAAIWFFKCIPWEKSVCVHNSRVCLSFGTTTQTPAALRIANLQLSFEHARTE